MVGGKEDATDQWEGSQNQDHTTPRCRPNGQSWGLPGDDDDCGVILGTYMASQADAGAVATTIFREAATWKTGDGAAFTHGI